MNRIATLLISCALAGAGVVEVPPATAASEKVLYSFCIQTNCRDGANPAASLINLNGTLYGTTYAGGARNGGTLFAIDPATGGEIVLHSFGKGKDGRAPKASLINMDGMLYGTTNRGGTRDRGTVFAFDPDTGVETVLYSFCSQDRCADGQYPDGNAIYLNGKLYSTTEKGGYSLPTLTSLESCHGSGCGTVFSFDPSTSAETVLYSFCGQHKCEDGEFPSAGLFAASGTLYGTTYEGGIGGSGCGNPTGCGTVFSLDLGTGAETVLHNFKSNGHDGFSPQASLIDLNGELYGTTLYGGDYHEGTVFSLDPQTGVETVVYSFCAQDFCPDGASPAANLLDANGTLYGTTYRGGTASDACNSNICGTVFSIDTTSGSETTVYAFCTAARCADGEAPQGGLIDVNGILYGTTSLGGTGQGERCNSKFGCGTVFAITP